MRIGLTQPETLWLVQCPGVRVDLGIDPYEMGGLLIKADTHIKNFLK